MPYRGLGEGTLVRKGALAQRTFQIDCFPTPLQRNELTSAVGADWANDLPIFIHSKVFPQAENTTSLWKREWRVVGQFFSCFIFTLEMKLQSLKLCNDFQISHPRLHQLFCEFANESLKFRVAGVLGPVRKELLDALCYVKSAPECLGALARYFDSFADLLWVEFHSRLQSLESIVRSMGAFWYLDKARAA